jgi:riboflavin synthase
MFTGIIESLATITKIEHEGTNVHFTIASSISKDLKIDQSLSHNGVCLTVTAQDADCHTVTAIEETLLKTNLGTWQIGNKVNLERAMVAGARLDGHIVQGHVDITGICINREDRNGSWLYTFQYKLTSPRETGMPTQYIVVDKGSVCVNGVSLTVVSPVDDTFSVAIIPYTFDNTIFQDIEIGSIVNLEFDIIGKYMARYFEVYKSLSDKL